MHFMQDKAPSCITIYSHIPSSYMPIKSEGKAWLQYANSLSFHLNHIDADPSGWYLIMDALFDNVPLVIANIYAPNSHQKQFYKTIMNKLSQFPKERTILCGDYNDTIDSTLDSSNHRKQHSTALHSLTQLGDLCDPWQDLHGSERDYTFYSVTQKSYSRIDPFLLHKHTLQAVSQAEIGLITRSDHAPVMVTISTTQNGKHSTIWHMNTFLSSQPKCQENIKQELEKYFVHNVNSVLNDVLLWNSHKAFMRGVLLNLGGNEKRMLAEKYNFLDQIRQLEKSNKTSPNDVDTARLHGLR